MTPLQWQEVPQNGDRAPTSVGPIPANVVGFIAGIIAGAAVSLLVVGLLLGYTIARWQSPSGSPQIARQDSAPQPPAPSAPLPPIDPKIDHIRGDIKKATVAIVEYSDFECPFCKRHHPTMQKVMDTYGDDVVWVYRHFPLSFHPNAQKAAESSECANELGGNDAFWKFTDGAFELDTLSTDAFVTVAKNIGLNEAKFKSCLDSGTYAKHVQDQMDAGAAAGVQGTPGNFVVDLKTQENKEISGAVPFDAFKTAIDAMLGSES